MDQPPGSVLDDLAEIEIPAIALSPNLSPQSIAQIKQGRWPVLGVWLYAERPEGMTPKSDPLKTLPLATPDREMQSRALQQALRSILLAADLGVPALVLPLLSPEGSSPSLGSCVAQRALDPLLEEGMRRQVRLALPLEGALLSEEKNLLALLQEFSGAPLAYWHRGVYQEDAPPPAPPIGTLTPGGILLLVPPPKPPPSPPEAPLFPSSLEAFLAGASVALPSLPPEEEPWPEGAWCRKLVAALGERPLVLEPERGRLFGEIERMLSRL